MLENDIPLIGRRITQAYREANLSASGLAEICGVTPQAVNGWLRSGSISIENLLKVAEATNRPMEWFLKENSSVGEAVAAYGVEAVSLEAANTMLPVVGTAQLGDNGHWDALDFPVGHGDGFVLYPTRDKNSYALRVKGDSMRPRIKPGEFVIVAPNGAIEPGQEVLVKTRDGRVMVKVLSFRREGLVELASINEDHRPITIEEAEIELIHSVVGFAKAALYYKDLPS